MRLSKRRLSGLGAAVAGCSLALAARVTAEDESSPPPATSYIAAGSELDFVIASAPLPTHQLGPIARASIDRVRGDASSATISVLGQPGPDAPPPSWPRRADGAAAARGPTPMAARAGKTGCRCATAIGDTAVERIAALYASRQFAVGAELADLALLRLRARYQDGIVIYLNGREVARRNIDADAATMAVARRLHGPEWETFYIPVVPGLLVAGSNTLAAEVRPAGNRLAPSLDLELVATGAAQIVRGPLVQRVGASSAVVMFDTDLPTFAAVEYGVGPARGQAAASAGGGLARHHVVELDGLPADSRIHYRVVAGGAMSKDLDFYTAPPRGAPIRFAVYGDVRGGHRVHGEIVNAMLRDAPDFVIATGDLVLRGSDEGDWQRFFAVAGELLARLPLYPAIGNHDMGSTGSEARRMNELFALWPGPPARPRWGHWYSFAVGDLHFVMLDSNSYEHVDQLRWLEADLAAARAAGARAIFAVTHDGPYSRGLHGGNRYAAEHYAPILSANGVTLLFSGHDHYYQRGRAHGLDYIVSGGGGAPLYKPRCGVAGRPRCKVADGMRHVAAEYHYVMVTVSQRRVTACAKRADGSPLEKCASYKLPR